jgi:uncharacterized spore protein YtfJ
MNTAGAAVTEEKTVGDDGARELIKIEETIEKMLDAANVDKVYGKPIEKGDTIIIPAAELKTGMGMGGGSGTGKKRQVDKEEEAEEGSGGGGGGGGHVRSRPVAIVVASNSNVHVEPVIDKTKITLTAIVANSILALLLFRMLWKR